MSNVITCNFCEPFLDNLTGYLEEHYLRRGGDLRRLAIVFGGKRPALFLKRELARRIGKSFYPPRFFTVDEWMNYVVTRQESFVKAVDLDQAYLLYGLARDLTPEVLKGREAFSQFLPWAQEILAFIEQLDLENVADDDLRHIKANAQIGYAVPDDINRLLESVALLRRAYHARMRERKEYSRGFQYLRAAEVIPEQPLEEFERIFFCNFFYFNRAEERVVKTLHERGRAVLFFQGDERKWPVFKRIGRSLGTAIREGAVLQDPAFDLKLYSAFDAHSQVALVREILKTTENLEKTVIVLPNPDHIIPLLSEIAASVQDFNISMGYPLKRSSLYALLEFVFKAQASRDDDGYYARDYLRVLRHPLVKNLNLSGNGTVVRVLVHKVEEILTGQELTEVSGSVFVDLRKIFLDDGLYDAVGATLQGMGIAATRQDLQAALAELHRLLFESWEGIGNFSRFADVLGGLLDVLIRKSFLSHYPLNTRIAARMLELNDEMKATAFRDEGFPAQDIFKIFDARMEREIVAFAGSPLKGMQILGLFETRSLSFENVIVLDVNEGTLPRLNVYEPLIPREVMISLNLDRLEREEEIQRYQFMRLLSSAKTVHLIYQESPEKERSRFVEELVWEQQKKSGRLDVAEVVRPGFTVQVTSRIREVRKTPEMIACLKTMRYSASSVNTYVRNPMEFYFNYVLGLREKEDLLEEPENRQVGTFIHELLETAFKGFVGKKPQIDAAFRNYFQKVFESRFNDTLGKSGRADIFLLKSVLETRLGRFLDSEADNEDRRVAEIVFIEKRFEDVIPLSCGDVHFVYRVDRVDRMEDGSVMVIDYKTGSVDPMPKRLDVIESLPLSRETVRDYVKSFQIPLYFQYLDKFFKGQPVNAAFYNLRTLQVDKFFDARMTYERSRVNPAFQRALDYIMQEILNPDVPFVEDTHEIF